MLMTLGNRKGLGRARGNVHTANILIMIYAMNDTCT